MESGVCTSWCLEYDDGVPTAASPYGAPGLEYDDGVPIAASSYGNPGLECDDGVPAGVPHWDGVWDDRLAIMRPVA